MVTPENGVLAFQGASGRIYTYNLYSSDVINAFVTFNANGIAGTGNQLFINAPENGQITDLAIHTGQTVSTNWVVQVSDQNYAVVPYTVILDTLTTRTVPTLKISAGKKISLLQQ